ncbi:MAG TPA: hypothetical protein VGP63_24515 [Planctomycetaceae bacterium]|nr:hypothetical protein [Planctomycetaceae bacterium]
MKTLRAVIALFVPAVLVLGASAGQASAGGRYGWGSAGCCGSTGGYGGSGCGGCGGGYGGCGSGCGCLSASGGSAFWIVGDYAPYIIGHGPMFPAGDSPHPAFWYGGPGGSDPSTAPSRR